MVSIPTVAEFRTRFGELASEETYPDALIQNAINVAKSISTVSSEGFLYLTAHLAVVMKSEETGELDGGSGEVSGEMSSAQSMSYTVMAEHNRDVFFTRSSYGRTFMLLESRAPKRVVSVRVF